MISVNNVHENIIFTFLTERPHFWMSGNLTAVGKCCGRGCGRNLVMQSSCL